MENENIYWVKRDPYTISELMEAIDNRLKSEKDPKMIIVLKEMRSGYLQESRQYILSLYKMIVRYIRKGDKQILTDIENVYLAQRNLKLYYNSIRYYLKKYYKKKDLIEICNASDLDSSIFNMKNLISCSKLTKILQKYAVSSEAKYILN